MGLFQKKHETAGQVDMGACPAISLSLWTATVVGQRSVGFRALPAIR